MKRILIYGAIAATIALAAGCFNDGKIVTKKFKEARTYELTEGCPDSIDIALDVDYAVSGISDSAVSSINSEIIATMFGEDYRTMNVEDAANRYFEDRTAAYRDSNLELWSHFKDSSETGTSGFLKWETKISGYFSGEHDGYISYVVFDYSYEGGAHGLSTETALTFDKKTGRLVPEEEFFVPGYQDEIPALLSAHLRDALPTAEAYDGLFIKDIEPNGNFMVSQAGVTYIYGAYEIAPYSMGIIKVTVPWEELTTLVRNNPTEEIK